MGDLPVDLEDLLSWKKLGYLVVLLVCGVSIGGFGAVGGVFFVGTGDWCSR